MKLPESIQQRLLSQHKSINDLVSGFDEQDLKFQARSGKWSAFENIAHLSSYQPIFLFRLQKIVGTEKPTFDRYRAEEDPLFYDHMRMSLQDLLSNVYLIRQQINDLLFSLDEMQLSRTGHHPRFGELSIVQWCEFFLLHESHHLFTIFQLIHERTEAQ